MYEQVVTITRDPTQPRRKFTLSGTSGSFAAQETVISLVRTSEVLPATLWIRLEVIPQRRLPSDDEDPAYKIIALGRSGVSDLATRLDDYLVEELGKEIHR